MINKWIVLLSLFQLTSWAETAFNTMEESFSRALVPQSVKALGSWAGHCVHSHEPDKQWPAVFESRAVLDEASNLETLTQTYFWEKRNEPDFFLRFSLDALNRYQPFLDWLKKEQWTPVQITSDGVTNTFELSQGGTISRSLKVDETEFSTVFYLQVKKTSSLGEQIISYCAFSQKLNPLAVPGTPLFSMQTGPLQNTWVDVVLPTYQGNLRNLRIRKNAQDPIRLSQVEIKLKNGSKLYYSPVLFEKGPEIDFYNENALYLKADSIRFYLEGWASNLEVIGISGN